MQFLPVAAETTTAVVEQAQSRLDRLQGDQSFGQVYSSFIEEGRENYTGLPPGFAAKAAEGGSLDRDTTGLLQKVLKRRGALEESIESLDQLLASGAPLSVGRIFSALSGNTRLTPELEGQERLDFKQIMQKLGFSTEEADDLLAMSDKGAGSAAWKRISQKLQETDGFELHGEELAALLKGLDISEGVQKQITKLLSEQQSLSLSSEQLNILLAEAGNEMAAKDLASRSVQKQMRAAMEEALEQARLNRKADPSADAKGTKLSEFSEATMQSSISKRVDASLSDTAGRDGTDRNGSHREDPDFSGDGKGRAERILTKGTSESEAGVARPKSKGAEAVDRMMQRIDATVTTPQPAQTGAAPQASLGELAGRHRQEIFTQIEQGVLSNLNAGGGRLTLQLNPQELGQISVVLSVHQGEVRATIRAENAESVAVLSDQLQQLRNSLEEAGLKVAELDVQTGLREDFTSWNWTGAEDHNLMRDAEERARMRRLAGLRREAVGTPETGETAISARTGSNGLYIVA